MHLEGCYSCVFLCVWLWHALKDVEKKREAKSLSGGRGPCSFCRTRQAAEKVAAERIFQAVLISRISEVRQTIRDARGNSLGQTFLARACLGSATFVSIVGDCCANGNTYRPPANRVRAKADVIPKPSSLPRGPLTMTHTTSAKPSRCDSRR